MENFVKIDVDAFIQEFKNFEIYFKKRVKLINEVTLKQRNNCFVFTLDTPSTDMELEFGIDKDYKYDPPKTCYYLKFDMFPVKIEYLSTSKEQFDSILKICKSIAKNAREREEEFNKSRLEVLVKLFKIMKNER